MSVFTATSFYEEQACTILVCYWCFYCRKHRGELLSLVKYNISISGISAAIKVPAKHDIQIQVRKRYTDNVRVYEVSNNLLFPEEFSFQLNVYGPGPGDNEMTLWEKVILDVYNTESNCSKSVFFFSMIDPPLSFSLKKESLDHFICTINLDFDL